jgi:hypothetical protein
MPAPESLGARLEAQLAEKRKVEGEVNPEFRLPLAIQRQRAETRIGKHWRMNRETWKLEEVKS